MEEGRPCFASSRSARIYVSRDHRAVTTYLFLIRSRLNSLSSLQDCRDAGKVVPNPLG